MPTLTELSTFLAKEFPQTPCTIVAVGDQGAALGQVLGGGGNEGLEVGPGLVEVVPGMGHRVKQHGGLVHGVLAGVVLIGVISSALRLESVTVNVTNIIVGLLLVASVVSTSVLARISRSTRPSPRGTSPQSAPVGVGTQER